MEWIEWKAQYVHLKSTYVHIYPHNNNLHKIQLDPSGHILISVSFGFNGTCFALTCIDYDYDQVSIFDRMRQSMIALSAVDQKMKAKQQVAGHGEERSLYTSVMYSDVTSWVQTEPL